MSIISQPLFHSIFGPIAAAAVKGCRHQYVNVPDRKVLLALSAAFVPRTVVEIGVQRGETAKLLLENGPWIREYIGIDVPPGTVMPLPGQQSEVPAAAGELALDDPRFRTLVRPRGSRDVTAAELALVCMVIIDGDHSAPAVLADTALARAILRPGGVCCWHDYGNKTVEVTAVIDQLNRADGQRICLVEGTWTCFEIRNAGGAVLAPPATPGEGRSPVHIGTAARTPSTASAAGPVSDGVPAAVTAAGAAGTPAAPDANMNGSKTPRRKGAGKPASAGVPASQGVTA